MCKQSVRCLSLPTVRLATFFLTTFVCAAIGILHSQYATAQAVGIVEDIANEARASRHKLAAEIAATDSAALREKLLKSAGNERLAHWYAGEVMIGGQWFTLKQAEQDAATDKIQSAYRTLRQQSSDSLSDHERLARWCQKKQLADLANMHWLHVLRFEPQNKAALKQLELRWHNGLLLTHDEAKRSEQREREWLKEEKAWRTKVKRLRRDLEKGQAKMKIAAREELHQIDEPAAVPALLEEFAEPAASKQLTIARRTELMTVLGGINSPAAVETLAQFAVESPLEAVRYTAVDQLKSKPLETYVPALLAGLAMPVEASVSLNTSGSRVVSSYSYAQEKPGGNEYTENRQLYQTVRGPRYRAVRLYRQGNYIPERTVQGGSYRVPITPGHGRGWVEHTRSGVCSDGNPYSYTYRRLEYGDEYMKEVKRPSYKVGGHYSLESAGIAQVEDPAFARRQQAALQRSRQQARQAGQALEQHNRATQLQNKRIADVLTEVTGETLSAYPKSWWNWWSHYLDQHPDVATAGTRQQLNMALLNQEPRGLARGTWVWTRRGKQPVETLLPGDYVLAQDPRTGELAYQVVMAIATPRDLAVSQIDLHDTQLHCAPGHVVWTTGAGWQRVSKLTAGQSLHGATTEVRVGQVNTAFEIDSYDLIVDGFHTFFVGEQGLLVHDATPIQPSHVALPGFSPAAVADAAQLANHAP